MLNITADNNIPYVTEVFSHLGNVRTLLGRQMSAEAVADADLLLTRSTVKVNEGLLEGSRVRFVATATAGVEHVDQQYLRRRGIAFASAPGSNANSVAEYVAAALLVLAGRGGHELEGRTVGVVGCGNVGSRVVAKARALGMGVVENDPPLARQTGDARYRPIEEALAADVVTLHVPLTREGPDATFHMVDGAFLSAMKPGAVLINASRGAVVAEPELKGAIQSARLSAVVLDVWEGEPHVNAELLEVVDIGTAHIAGHSFDGKAAGTAMVYQAACDFLGVEPAMDVRQMMPEPLVPRLTASGDGSEEAIIGRAVRQVYDITADDARMRGVLTEPEDRRAAFFDSLRKNYPVRREFFNTRLKMDAFPAGARARLLALGFREDDQ